ncbi:MAG: hypothetical protein WAS72_04050, partial [Saprospiraceae bacterium]
MKIVLFFLTTLLLWCGGTTLDNTHKSKSLHLANDSIPENTQQTPAKKTKQPGTVTYAVKDTNVYPIMHVMNGFKRTGVIGFYDTVTKKEIKRIDVKRFNPYLQLPLVFERDTFEQNESGLLFDLSRSDNRNTINKLLTKIGININSKEDKIGGVSIGESGCVISKNYNLLAYGISVTSTKHKPLGGQTTFIVLNNQGEITAKFTDNMELGSMALTEDGRYIFAFYGGIYGCGGGEVTPSGFRIYEVKTGKVVYEEDMSDQAFEGAAGKFNYLIMYKRIAGKGVNT